MSSDTPYPNVQLHIDGAWRDASGGGRIAVVNPASEEEIGTVAHASRDDLDAALEASARGFAVWRKVSAYDRSSSCVAPPTSCASGPRPSPAS